MLDILREQVSMLSSEALAEKGVLDWAAPVPVFGDIYNAHIATVGINPSNLEFQDSLGNELTGQDRRFHSLYSLGLDEWSETRKSHLKEIEESCVHYFHNRPYTRWFNQLDYLLVDTGYSFFNYFDQVCHFDLVPYATGDKWASVSAKNTKLLKELSKHSLVNLVDKSSVRMMVLNGQQVVNEYQDIFGEKLTTKKKTAWNLPRKNGSPVQGFSYEGELRLNNGNVIKVLGFNHNIQSSFGVTRKVKNSIGKWLSGQWNEI